MHTLCVTLHPVLPFIMQPRYRGGFVFLVKSHHICGSQSGLFGGGGGGGGMCEACKVFDIPYALYSPMHVKPEFYSYNYYYRHTDTLLIVKTL